MYLAFSFLDYNLSYFVKLIISRTVSTDFIYQPNSDNCLLKCDYTENKTKLG